MTEIFALLSGLKQVICKSKNNTISGVATRYVYIYIYIYIYVCMYVCMYVYIYIQYKYITNIVYFDIIYSFVVYVNMQYVSLRTYNK